MKRKRRMKSRDSKRKWENEGREGREIRGICSKRESLSRTGKSEVF